MNVFYTLIDCEQSDKNEFDSRFTVEPVPAVGHKTWMNPDTLEARWEVISTHLFRSDSGVTVCLAKLANAPILHPEKFGFDEPGYCDSIILYFMDDQFFTHSIGGGFSGLAPEIGPFEEYENYTCRLKPITKAISHYETLTGDGSCQFYVAYLQPVLVPVAA